MTNQIKITTNAAPSSDIFVNDIEIMERDIGSEMQHHPAGSMEESRFSATQALVVRELLLQKAKTLGLHENVESIDVESIDDESEEEALIRLLIEQEVEYPSASEENCQRYFESNKERFRTTALLEVSHILIAAAPDDADERGNAKKLAVAVIEKLTQSPRSFARLAKEHSSCPSAKVDGSLGQLSKGQTVPEFEKVLFST
ncbi:MAG: peptidylprolyl isomerase, partial [Pseudomonadales bacterium]|nr:peptidylprolyl isomerase [Pseudomonadales bacterium]